MLNQDKKSQDVAYIKLLTEYIYFLLNRSARLNLHWFDRFFRPWPFLEFDIGERAIKRSALFKFERNTHNSYAC